jgi:peptidoglycan/xylan/chitin deacetylase (PgdA/CDA1 family)
MQLRGQTLCRMPLAACLMHGFIGGGAAGAQTTPTTTRPLQGAQATPAATKPLKVVPSPPGKLEDRYRSSAEVKARDEWEEEHFIRFPKLVRGNPRRRVVALTFDDGPHPIFTQQLLSILQQENVTATFFVIGENVDAHPELVQQAAAQGIEIANHTYHHLRLPTIPVPNIATELKEGALAIQRAIGYSTRLYRPPGGEYDLDVINTTRELEYVMVLWTDDPADYVDPGLNVIEERVLRTISDGGIILLHDGAAQTVQILPDLIRRLKARGYRFVTCSALARENGVITNGGPVVLPTPPRPAPPPAPRKKQ